MLDIIGVGDANVDVMISVPYLPSHDEKVRGKLIGYYPGGITANFCSAAAAFGAKVGAVCKLGDDSYGHLSMEDLRGRGVDVSHMAVDSSCETYFCMIQLDGTGEKALTIVETSGFVPKREDIDLGYLRTARRVHMTTLDPELVAYVAEGLEGSGVRLSLDIEATAGKCPPETWARVLPHVDTAFPNEAGLAALTGERSPSAGARQLLARGVGTVVVTCGAEGARIFTHTEQLSVPAFQVAVKDTTGAGDCFNAVFLCGLTRGWGRRKAAQYAAAAAAISIGAVGARTALPDEAYVKQFLAERGV